MKVALVRRGEGGGGTAVQIRILQVGEGRLRLRPTTRSITQLPHAPPLNPEPHILPLNTTPHLLRDEAHEVVCELRLHMRTTQLKHLQRGRGEMRG